MPPFNDQENRRKAADRKEELQREKQGTLIAHMLALVAGFVDAVGYIVLFKMFTANMSGNSVALGIYLEELNGPEILHRAFPIPCFILGAFLGSLFLEWSTRHAFKRVLPSIYFIEAVLIGLFLTLGDPVYAEGALRAPPLRFYGLAALPALAMGLQTAALHRIGGLNVRTTFVTGMLTGFCKNLATYLFWLRDRFGFANIRAIVSESTRQVFFIRLMICGGIWIFYMIGAVLGAYFLAIWEFKALSVALFILAAIIAVSYLKGETAAQE